MAGSWNRFFYRVEGLYPTDTGSGLSRFGFIVNLDRDFARKALQKEMTEHGRKHFVESAKRTVGMVGLGGFGEPRYQFVDDSCLLQFCMVPGDACDLGMDPMKIPSLRREIDELNQGKRIEGIYKSPITYGPHNVDGYQQAYALLSMWTHWANMVNAWVDE